MSGCYYTRTTFFILPLSLPHLLINNLYILVRGYTDVDPPSLCNPQSLYYYQLGDLYDVFRKHW